MKTNLMLDLTLSVDRFFNPPKEARSVGVVFMRREYPDRSVVNVELAVAYDNTFREDIKKWYAEVKRIVNENPTMRPEQLRSLLPASPL